MPALILREFLGKYQSMRPGAVRSGKNRPRFVRIPVAIINVEIEPASFSQNACLGFVEYAGSGPRETLDMVPGCLLQRAGHEVYNRIDSVRKAATDLLVNTEDNAMRRRIEKPRP